MQATDIADLVTTTLNELGELKFTDLMSDYQDTIALKRIFKKGKVSFDAGPEIQFNVILGTNESARFVPLGATDRVNIKNVMTTGKIGWRHVTWNWGIERREIAMNRTPRKIVDLTKTRRMASFGSAVELFEQAMWRAPALTNETDPYGIPTWVVKSNTAATAANNDGFNGLAPSGFTTLAEINPTTNTRWRNYATQYTNIDFDDLVPKMRRASRYTAFKPLVQNMPTYDLGRDYGYYTNYTVISAFEDLLRQQNENMGNDIAAKDGDATFMRTAVTWVKELDQDTTDPIYGLYWGELFATGLRGEWMRETPLPIVPNQHTVSATFTDCTFNIMCRNRRRQFVIAKDTGLPV